MVDTDFLEGSPIPMNERWSNRLKNLTIVQVIRFLVGALVLTSLGSLLLNILRSPELGDEFTRWWENWLLEMSGEIGGAAVILILLEWMLRHVNHAPNLAAQPTEEARRAQNETLLKDYIERLKAANTRERRQVILDEMKKRDLLAGANLNNLNLQGANFYDTNLQGVSMEGTNLRGAYFIEANLNSAKLSEADLSEAELSWADLGGAFLGGAKLDAAWLLRANLEGAFLKTTEFGPKTRMPDGASWTGETQIERFTNPAHPNFWRPDPGFFGELPRWYRRTGRR